MILIVKNWIFSNILSSVIIYLVELVIKDILLNHGVIFENHFYVSPLVSFITLILYLLLASIISVLPMKIINKVSMNEIISEVGKTLNVIFEMNSYDENNKETKNIELEVVGILADDIQAGNVIAVPLEITYMINDYYSQNPSINTRNNYQLRVYCKDINSVEGVEAFIKKMGFGVTSSVSVNAISKIFRRIVNNYIYMPNVIIYLEPSVIILSLLSTVMVSTLAAYFPARKVSKLEIVNSLNSKYIL